MSLKNRIELAVDEVMGRIISQLQWEVDKKALRKDIFESMDSLAEDVYSEGYQEGLDSERFWGHIGGEYKDDYDNL